MKIKNTDKCRCGHFKADHGVIKSKKRGIIRYICWGCVVELPMERLEGVNLDSYHEFRLQNLDYLQRLYEKKHKIK